MILLEKFWLRSGGIRWLLFSNIRRYREREHLGQHHLNAENLYFSYKYGSKVAWNTNRSDYAETRQKNVENGKEGANRKINCEELKSYFGWTFYSWCQEVNNILRRRGKWLLQINIWKMLQCLEIVLEKSDTGIHLLCGPNTKRCEITFLAIEFAWLLYLMFLITYKWYKVLVWSFGFLIT